MSALIITKCRKHCFKILCI